MESSTTRMRFWEIGEEREGEVEEREEREEEEGAGCAARTEEEEDEEEEGEEAMCFWMDWRRSSLSMMKAIVPSLRKAVALRLGILPRRGCMGLTTSFSSPRMRSTIRP